MSSFSGTGFGIFIARRKAEHAAAGTAVTSDDLRKEWKGLSEGP